MVDDTVREEITKVIKHAQTNVVDLIGMRERGELEEGSPNPAPGDDKNFIVFVPPYYKVVYSHEDQGPGDDERIGLGICKHFSMSIAKKGKVPDPIAVDMMLEEFGFAHPLYQCIVWAETFDGAQKAINVIEPIDDWPDEETKAQVREATKNIINRNTREMIDARRAANRETVRDTEVSTGV
jgi:hypothetical protein